VARAHGEFTPRHLRVRDGQLLVAGWQMSEEDLPAMYDWFHFIYYTRTLIDQQPFSAIRREIDDTLDEPQWEAFLLEHDIDPGEAEQQYLLCAVSRFVQQRKTPDAAAVAMLQNWCEALGFWTDFEGLLTQRQIVLQDIIHFLHEKQYTALRLPAADITALPPDQSLELCIRPEGAAALRRYLKQHRCVERLRTRPQVAGRKLSVFLSSGASIHIQCQTSLRYGGLMFGDAGRLLAMARINDYGVRQLPLTEDLKYAQLVRALRREEALPAAVCEPVGSGARLSAPALFTQCPNVYAPQPLSEALKRHPANKGLRRWMRQLHHGWELLRSLAPRRGFIITFSGLDASAQRNVIEATRHRIRTELQAPVVVLPHRPRLKQVLAGQARRHKALSARRNLPGNPLLRAGEDLLVQLCVLLKHVLRGHVVLYDQYFDCEDAQQRVRLPAAFTSWWHRFLMKPDLNFLLYAPVNAVHERHRELSTDDIERLTGEYLALFSKLERQSGQGDFIPVRNTRLGDTLETLFRHIHTRQLTL
jgi:thymidylate kinase